MSLSQILRAGEPALRLPTKTLVKAAELPDGDVLLQSPSSLYRVSPQGDVRWKADGLPCTRELVGPGDQVMLGSEAGYSRVDLETGQVAPPRPWPPNSYAPEYGPDGELVFATSKSSALRVQGDDPPRELRIAFNGFTHFLRSKCPTTAGVAPDGSVVVFEAFDGVCRTREGDVKWRHRFDEAVGEMTYLRGRWLFPDNQGSLFSLDAETGRAKKLIHGLSPNACNISADCVTPGPEGIVYFYPRQSKLVALDEQTGRVLFSHGRNAHDPVQETYYQYQADYADGKLYLTRPDLHQVDVLDARTGELLDRLESKGSAPRVVGDFLVSQEDHQLRLDPLHPVPEEPSGPGGAVEQKDGWLLVGGVPLRNRES